MASEVNPNHAVLVIGSSPSSPLDPDLSPAASRPPTPETGRFFSPDSLWRQRQLIPLDDDEIRSRSPDGQQEPEPFPRLPVSYSSSSPNVDSTSLGGDIWVREQPRLPFDGGTASTWGVDAIGELLRLHASKDFDTGDRDLIKDHTDSGFHSMSMSRQLSGPSLANSSGLQSRSRTWELQKIEVVEKAKAALDANEDKAEEIESQVGNRSKVKSNIANPDEDKGISPKLILETGNSGISLKGHSDIHPVSRRKTVEVEDVSDEGSAHLFPNYDDIKKTKSSNSTEFPISQKRKLFSSVSEHPHFRHIKGKGKDGLNFQQKTCSTTTIHSIVDGNTGELVGREVEKVTSKRTSALAVSVNMNDGGDGEGADGDIGNSDGIDSDFLSPIEKVRFLPNPYNITPTPKPPPSQERESGNVSSSAGIADDIPSQIHTSEAVEEIVHRAALSPSSSSQNLFETSVRISQINHTSVSNGLSAESNDTEDATAYSTLEINTTHLYQELFHSSSRSTLDQYPSLHSPTSTVGRLLNRSRNSLRRMLNARETFIGARSRSFLRRLRNDLEAFDHGNGILGFGNAQNLIGNGLIAELDGGDVLPGRGAHPPVELDGVEREAGPFELSVVGEPDHGWGTYGAQPHLLRCGTFARSSRAQTFVCTSLFGPNFKISGGKKRNGGLEGICNVYMEQIDEMLEASMRNCELETPNIQQLPQPLGYLVYCLGLVGANMQAGDTTGSFVRTHYKELMSALVDGPLGIGVQIQGLESGLRDSTQPDERYLRLAHQWMLFSLEAWTSLNFTSIVGEKFRQNPVVSNSFCTKSLKDMITPLLPPAHLRYDKVSSGDWSVNASTTLTQIFPHEMTASMLSSLTGVKFIWTNDLSSHLLLDRKTRTISIYSNITVAYLHTVAGDESSLNRAGLTSLQRLLSEVVESYKLLFGHSEKDHKLFREMDAENRPKGFFDIFSIPNADTGPRWLYTIATRNNTTREHPSDFLVYGERLVELRSLLKPKGLKGLWRDKRDTLQWWTFWAVVAIGLVSLLLAVIQTALGTIQAYASMKALHPSGSKK